MTKKARIAGIDICRSVAIVAAMTSHCLIEAGAFNFQDSGWITATRFVFQLSPPLFIGLFGSMLHIAYRPKFARGEVEAGVSQLLSRAAQCYLLYALCLLVTWMVGDTSLAYTVRCLLLLGVTPYVDILKFYAVMLVVAPAAIFVASRYRWGLAALFAGSLIPHLAFPIMSSWRPPSDFMASKYLDLPAGFIYGGAQGVGGPSLLHGFYFVVIGMVVGVLAEQLIAQDAGARRRARLSFAAIGAASLFLTAILWSWSDPAATARQIADMTLRNHNHPIYFSLGTFAMVVFAWAALEVYDLRKTRFGREITFVASASLFTFSFGNIVLILAPSFSFGPGGRFVYGGVLLAVVLGLTWLFKWSLKHGDTDSRDGKRTVVATVYRVQHGIVGFVQATMRRPAMAYAKALNRNRS
jgi:hypothetical protein